MTTGAHTDDTHGAAAFRPGMTADDTYLFNQGNHRRLYRHLGAHPLRAPDHPPRFSVWAPRAARVSVVGDFNNWQPGAHPLERGGGSGVWWGDIKNIREGALYKYHIESAAHQGYRVDKTDPFGFRQEPAPRTASIVHTLDYTWNDHDWMRARAQRQARNAPISIYELHPGSWRRKPDGTHLTYEELAEVLPAYLRERGFTHVELMPVTEHPLYRSWGYQTVGYFAPTSRYGTAQGLMRLIDALHAQDIAVVLDWVPAHFPSDEHGLGYFDGTHLFEHADPRQGFHPDWKSLIFNYGRNEVRSFLISSAAFWLDLFHIDALRLDAVASMLHLDYSRKEGEWVANKHGGRENLEAIDFLKTLNSEIETNFPGVVTFAEDSTSWPRVTGSLQDDGLGFTYKWDMGWMNDSLKYLARDPLHRKHHHHDLTFRSMYAWSECYTLPLSHDEVVHMKGSLYGRMPGDHWRKLAQVRLLLAWQWFQPGKKLLFMGCELAQPSEWDHASQIEWHLAGDPAHAGVRDALDQLNALYKDEPALHEGDCHSDGFQWLRADDEDRSTYAFARIALGSGRAVVCVFNMTPEPRMGDWVGVPNPGPWREALNTDDQRFGGSGITNANHNLTAEQRDWEGQPARVQIDLPPLGALILVPSE